MGLLLLLSYSEDLEKKAETWVESCQSDKTNTENDIGMTKAVSSDANPTFANMIATFGVEGAKFDYESDSCGSDSCTNYKQVGSVGYHHYGRMCNEEMPQSGVESRNNNYIYRIYNYIYTIYDYIYRIYNCIYRIYDCIYRIYNCIYRIYNYTNRTYNYNDCFQRDYNIYNISTICIQESKSADYSHGLFLQTRIVWAETIEVGCAKMKCPKDPAPAPPEPGPNPPAPDPNPPAPGPDPPAPDPDPPAPDPNPPAPDPDPPAPGPAGQERAAPKQTKQTTQMVCLYAPA
ncbi:unnamed protein product [Mesocestoides corti]|uniref:SCP domain-containing protein n=1 Tax=Mesocestoides corti TaxID=53468 RepID=A0A158QV58_MESCO|nr:unnamed protein product [Mesocestoides corti]